MLVSVIIPTKNEEKNISTCLESVLGQDFSRGQIEIIVVDNNSTDRTKEIAKKYTDNVFDHGPERSAQRNFGAGKSRGDYFMYIDADMILSREVIQKCVEEIESDSDIIALYIPEIISGKNFWNRVRNLERSFYDGTAIDAPRFLRKDKFFEVGGFDENFTGPEDWDLGKRLKSAGKIGIADTVLFHNEDEFTLKTYLKKKKYYSRDFEKYIAKWGKNDPDIRHQFGFWYRYVGVFTENGKWKRLIRHPLLAAGMYLERFLVGLNYALKRK